MGDVVYSLGYMLGTLLIVGLIPVVIGGFYPFGTRATPTRTTIAWIVAVFLGLSSWNGGGSAFAPAIAIAFVAVAYLTNRSRPPKTN